MFVLLVLISSQLSAYSLAVKVTVSQSTLAVGTNISLVRGGVEVANAKAGTDGTATFNVAPGSYFVLLNRYPYPQHVFLIGVDKDTAVELTMRELISYANVYGQISGPTDFSNSSITLYSGGNIAKKVTQEKNGYPDKNGYYIISFLPEASYEIAFNVQGFDEKRSDVFLPNAQFIEINPKLSATAQKAEPEPVLSAPSSVQQYSVLTVYLNRGGQPLAGQSVSVRTPSGTVVIVTGADGKAYINAAEAGSYSFAYGSLSAGTAVQAKEAPVTAPPANNETQQEPPAYSPPVQQPQQADLFPLLVVAGLAVLLLVLIVAVALMVLRSKKGGQGGSKQSQHAAHSQASHHDDAHHAQAAQQHHSGKHRKEG